MSPEETSVVRRVVDALSLCIGDGFDSDENIAAYYAGEALLAPQAAQGPADERAAFEAAFPNTALMRAIDPAVSAWEAWQARAAQSGEPRVNAEAWKRAAQAALALAGEPAPDSGEAVGEVRNCTWTGQRWSVQVLVPTKLRTGTKLYTRPTGERRPMTSEDMRDVARSLGTAHADWLRSDWPCVRLYTRAVEKFHDIGITGEPTP